MNLQDVYAREWRKLAETGEVFNVDLNFMTLHAILCAMQVSLTVPVFAVAQRETITVIGKTLQSLIDSRSPALGAIMAQGWEPNQKIAGMEIHPIEEPPCSDPFSEN